ncbi:MAG: grasp-with-spasm system SPASM domain peptide maturase [Bacteroidota bacterium]
MHKATAFMLHANCQLVEGAQQAVIYDLQRGTYFFIPLSLAHFLKEAKAQPLEGLFEQYGEENRSIIEEYIEYLVEHDLAFICNFDEQALFPSTSLKWSRPAACTRAIIDLTTLDLTALRDRLDYFPSTYPIGLEIRLLAHMGKDTCQQLASIIFEEYPHFSPLDMMAYTEDLTLLPLTRAWSRDEPRIRYLLLVTPEVQDLSIFQQTPSFSLQKGDLESFRKYAIEIGGRASLASFTVNVHLYTEAQHFHPYFNGQICIDTEGLVKAAPHASESAGHFRETSFQSAVNHPAIQSLWYIKKDDIEICKDCEFRYMCLDARVPQRNLIESSHVDIQHAPYIHTSACKYDPYTTTWQTEQHEI